MNAEKVANKHYVKNYVKLWCVTGLSTIKIAFVIGIVFIMKLYISELWYELLILLSYNYIRLSLLLLLLLLRTHIYAVPILWFISWRHGWLVRDGGSAGVDAWEKWVTGEREKVRLGERLRKCAARREDWKKWKQKTPICSK